MEGLIFFFPWRRWNRLMSSSAPLEHNGWGHASRHDRRCCRVSLTRCMHGRQAHGKWRSESKASVVRCLSPPASCLCML